MHNYIMYLNESYMGMQSEKMIINDLLLGIDWIAYSFTHTCKTKTTDTM